MPQRQTFRIASMVVAVLALMGLTAAPASAGLVKLKCNDYAVVQAHVETASGQSVWVWCLEGRGQLRYGSIRGDFDIAMWIWESRNGDNSKQCTGFGGPHTLKVSKQCKQGRAYGKVTVLTDLYFDIDE